MTTTTYPLAETVLSCLQAGMAFSFPSAEPLITTEYDDDDTTDDDAITTSATSTRCQMYNAQTTLKIKKENT